MKRKKDSPEYTTTTVIWTDEAGLRHVEHRKARVYRNAKWPVSHAELRRFFGDSQASSAKRKRKAA